MEVMNIQNLIKHFTIILHQSPQIILDSRPNLLPGIFQQIIAHQRLPRSGRQQPVRIHQATDKESPRRQQVTIVLTQQHTFQIYLMRIAHGKLRTERQNIKHAFHPAAFGTYPESIEGGRLKSLCPIVEQFLAGRFRIEPDRRRRIHQLLFTLIMQINRVRQYLAIIDQYLFEHLVFKKMHPVTLGMQHHL